MGANITKEDVACQGITDITTNDIEKAKTEKKRWKGVSGDGVGGR